MDSWHVPAVESMQKVPISVASALVSAVHEWLLIFMLFIDASFSYLVTRFARRCKLQIPCLLCSRLDHVLGKESPGFVWNLMCREHKSKISSLVLCRLHENLVDVHGTCESCFFSFATIDKSNAETYRLLVGKLGDEPHYWIVDCALSAQDNLGPCNTRKCCCCNEQWILRTPNQKLLHTKSSDSEKHELVSPIVLASKFSKDELQEITEGSPQSHHLGSDVADPLSHIGYEKVKVTSDTESEAQTCDDETSSTFIREIATSEQDSRAVSALLEPRVIATAVDTASKKLMHSLHSMELSLSEPDDSPNSCRKEKSEETLGHGIEELSCRQADNKDGITTPSDLISFTKELDEFKDINSTNTSDLGKEVTIEHQEVPLIENDSTRTEVWKDVNMESGETAGIKSDSVTVNETQSELKPITDTSSQTVDSFDLGDAYRIAVGTRGRQLSGKLLEQQLSMQESKRASEDLKLLLSQISAVRGFELSLNDISPRVQTNSEDYTSTDASGSTGAQILQRRMSLERNESSLSIDGSIASEIEGESMVDRLRRQVEHDKKIMGALYKELEEERNAAAVAANQAMAMITRLQEEKASIHMEALQYLRMMEEQAEYDGEAFQEVNDLLLEKEKQIQALEAELEQSKNAIEEDLSSSSNYLEESSMSDASKLKAGKPEEHREESSTTSLHRSDYNKHGIINRTDGLPNLFKDMETIKIFMLPIEDAKKNILKSLKKLEEKAFVFSKNEVKPDMTSAFEEFDGSRISKEDDTMGNDNLSDEAFANKKVPASLYINNLKSGFDDMSYELSVIIKRLEVLDIEQCIIECSMNSVENGEEGF